MKQTLPSGFLEDLRGLIRIPSVSGPPEGDAPYGAACQEALAYMLELCRSFGFRTKNLDNQVGYAEIGEGPELIGILAHLDVVPAGTGWTVEPFDLTLRDGKLLGRGVLDDKGPAMMAVYALKALLDSGRPLTKRYRLIFGCNEEKGDWEDIRYYLEREETPAFGFTPDSDFPVVYAEKGILQAELSLPLSGSGLSYARGGEAVNMVPDRCELRTSGPDPAVIEAAGRSAHGSVPGEGVNAIDRALEQLAGSSPFIDFYLERFAGKWDGSGLGLDLSDEASGGTTLNVGQIDSEGDHLTFTVDIRYPVTKKPEEVRAMLARALEGSGIQLRVLCEEAPSYVDPELPFVKKLMEAYRRVSGDECTPPQVQGGGTYAKALPGVVAFGPCLPGRECTEHQADEYLPEEDMAMICEIYRQALEGLS